MAPRKREQPAPEPQEGALATEAQQQAEAQAASMESLREFTRDTAVLLLFYTIVRSAWHLGVPAYFGAQPFVPLTAELALFQSAAILLYWAGGGFAGAARERPWMLNIYNLMAIAVVGKCVLDVYVYQLDPRLWAHFNPTKPWGVPALLESRLPGGLGPLDSRMIGSIAKWLEYLVDTLCLLGAYKGIRGGKTLMQARRVLKRAQAKQVKPQEQKKED